MPTTHVVRNETGEHVKAPPSTASTFANRPVHVTFESFFESANQVAGEDCLSACCRAHPKNRAKYDHCVSKCRKPAD